MTKFYKLRSAILGLRKQRNFYPIWEGNFVLYHLSRYKIYTHDHSYYEDFWKVGIVFRLDVNFRTHNSQKEIREIRETMHFPIRRHVLQKHYKTIEFTFGGLCFCFQSYCEICPLELYKKYVWEIYTKNDKLHQSLKQKHFRSDRRTNFVFSSLPQMRVMHAFS